MSQENIISLNRNFANKVPLLNFSKVKSPTGKFLRSLSIRANSEANKKTPIHFKTLSNNLFNLTRDISLQENGFNFHIKETDNEKMSEATNVESMDEPTVNAVREVIQL